MGRIFLLSLYSDRSLPLPRRIFLYLLTPGAIPSPAPAHWPTPSARRTPSATGATSMMRRQGFTTLSPGIMILGLAGLSVPTANLSSLKVCWALTVMPIVIIVVIIL